LLNPALAFGQMLVSLDFEYWLIYLTGPFLASGLALVFYEFVFLRSLEYLNDVADYDDEQSGISMDERKDSERIKIENEEEEKEE
jgi:hypothetical protein